MVYNILFKKASLLAPIFLIITVILFVASSYSGQNLKPYQKLAIKADLIVIGTVDNIKFERAFFGKAGDKPYYATYQYITVVIDKVIKGAPKSSPVVIQSTSSFVEDPEFSQDEKVILTLKWFEDPIYGNYYAIVGGGKFSIVESESFPIIKITNERLMGENWSISLEDFLSDIEIAK